MDQEQKHKFKLAVHEVTSIFKHRKVEYADMNIHQKINLRCYLKWLIDESPGTTETINGNLWRGGRMLEIEEPKRTIKKR